jgi:hypothetical protein
MAGFIRNLPFGFDSPVKRRAGFPSWSWTGWHGVLARTSICDRHAVLGESFDIQITLETINGLQITWPAFESSLASASSEEFSGRMIVKCWTMGVRIEQKEVNESFQLESALKYASRVCQTMSTSLLKRCKIKSERRATQEITLACTLEKWKVARCSTIHASWC